MTNPIPNFGMPDTRPGYAFQSPGSVGGIDLSAIVQAIIAGNRLQQGQQGLNIEQQRTDQAGTYQQGLIEQERNRQAAAAAAAAQQAQNQGEIGSALQAMMMGGQQVPVGGFRTAMAPELSLEQAAGMVRPQNVPALVDKAAPIVRRQEGRKAEAKAKAGAEKLLRGLSPEDKSAVDLYFAARDSGVDDATALKLFGGMVSPKMIAQIDREHPEWKELPNPQKAELWMTEQKEKLQLRYAPRPQTGGEAKLRPLPTSVIKTVAENKANLSSIDEAIGLMEGMTKSKAGKVTGLGWTNFLLGDEAKNLTGFSSEKEIQLRAAIADMGSMEIRSRSGAAVTAAEFPRLRPFIPKTTDTPKVVATKLARFKKILQEETDLYLENFGPDQGYHPIQGVTGTKTEETPPPAGNLYSKYGLERP